MKKISTLIASIAFVIFCGILNGSVTSTNASSPLTIDPPLTQSAATIDPPL